jgi:uncharacterized membrane protein
MEYLIVKWLHVVSATMLFGTGVGSAFYLFFTTLHRDVRAIAVVSRYVVVADWAFTATTAVVQPLTGFYLAHSLRIPLTSWWLGWSLALYIVAIACWLPVVLLQIRLRDLAAAADHAEDELPPRFWVFFKIWIALGVPALLAFLAIFFLMIAKPV